MSKKRRQDIEKNTKTQEPVDFMPQHEAPAQILWPSFESCWHACVKNGSPVLMESCKAHIKSLGCLNRPDKWIECIIHFGIEIEK